MFPAGGNKLPERQNEKNSGTATWIENMGICLIVDTLECIVNKVASNILRCVVRACLFSLLRVPGFAEIFIHLAEYADGNVSKVEIVSVDRNLK